MSSIDYKQLLPRNHSQVDVAIMTSKPLQAIEKLDSHIIELDAKYMSIVDFFRLFYCGDMYTFQLNKAQRYHDAMAFHKQSFQMKPFNLLQTITSLYSMDLKKNLMQRSHQRYFDPSSLIMMNKSILRYRSIVDCPRVRTSLSAKMIIEKIIEHTRRSYNTATSNDSATATSTSPSKMCVYGFHRLMLYVMFQSSHPDIKNVIIQFNYIVRITPESFDTPYFNTRLDVVEPSTHKRITVSSCSSSNCPYEQNNGSDSASASTTEPCYSKFCPHRYEDNSYSSYNFQQYGNKLSMEFLNATLDGTLSEVLEHYLIPYQEGRLHCILNDPGYYLSLTNRLRLLECENKLASILLITLKAIYDFRKEKGKTVRLDIQLKESQKLLQDYIDGLNKPKECVDGTSGSLGFTKKLKLVPLYSLYISNYGMPTKEKPIDKFILEELNNYLLSKGIDPYGRKKKVDSC